ncbi:MAG: O-antigen ligase family protein [Gaiellaceae bacterium]
MNSLVSRPSQGDWGGPALVGLLLFVAAGVGLLVVHHAFYGAAVVLGAGIALLVAADITALPLFLVLTMFVESVSLGSGLRIGRLAAVMALAVLMYYALSRGRISLRPNALLVAAGAYGLWILFSAYWATDSGLVYRTTFQYLLAVSYMLTFAVLVRSSAQVLAILATFAVGSLVFGIVSFVEYFRHGSQYFQSGLGATGLQGDHVYFAIYQVISLPAVLALAATDRRPQRQAVYYAIVGVVVLSVVASLSRTGLVVLGSVVFATLLAPWRLFFRSARQKLTYTMSLAGAAVVAAIAGSDNFIKRAETIFNYGGPNGDRGSGRIDLWRAAWRGFTEHPWHGLGAGNFQAKALDLLQTTPGVNTAASYVHAGRVVHNGYLEALTELGVVGFALFMLVLGLASWSYLSTFRRARALGDRLLERLAISLLVSMAGFAVSMFFASNELGKPLWIFVGLAIALEAMVRRAAPAPARPRPASQRIRAAGSRASPTL